MSIFESIRDAISRRSLSEASTATIAAAVAPGSAVQKQTNWAQAASITDLLELAGLDPNLSNRMQLAEDLGYKSDIQDSQAMDDWLHSAVMRHLSENRDEPAPITARSCSICGVNHYRHEC
jgi:hypothetical protein